MRAGRKATAALAVLTAVLAGSSVSTHRLDECLQAARIAVEPGYIDVELTLTPGVAVAPAIVSDIDRNRDGSMSSDEKRAYVASVLAAVQLEVDGRSLRLDAGHTTVDDLAALQRGEGTIRLQSRAALPDLSEGPHQVFFRNAYRRDISVYLANALVPESDRVAVRSQLHDSEQRELTIDYVLSARRPASIPLWLLGSVVAGLLGVFIVRMSPQPPRQSAA